MSVSAIFGSREAGLPSALEKIYDETKEGDNVNYSTVQLTPGSVYLFVRYAITISTGKYYGSTVLLITTPADEAFDSTEYTALTLGSGGSTGTYIVGVAGTGFRWRCSSAAYRVRIAVYKLT